MPGSACHVPKWPNSIGVGRQRTRHGPVALICAHFLLSQLEVKDVDVLGDPAGIR